MIQIRRWIINITVDSFNESYHINLLEYCPFPKQQQFHELENHASSLCIIGGNGSGKTYTVAQAIAKHVTGRYHSEWVGRRFTKAVDVRIGSVTAKMTRDVLQKLLFGTLTKPFRGPIVGDGQGIIHHKLVKNFKMMGSTGLFDYVEVYHKSGGISKIDFFTYTQGDKALQGSRFDILWLDELPDEKIYSECVGRMMTRPDAMMYLTFFTQQYNPVVALFLGEAFDLKANVFQENAYKSECQVVDGKTYMFLSWDDNPNITDAEKERREKSLPEHERQARRYGISFSGSNIIYNFPKSKIIVPSFQIPDHWPRICGMDFGYVNPTAVMFFALDRDYARWYLYKEYYVRNLTPVAHAPSLLLMGLDWIPTYADRSGDMEYPNGSEKIFDTYRNNGINLLAAKNGKKEKASAIYELYNMIENNNFKVFGECVNFLDEFSRYSYGRDGRPIKVNDHAMNSTEYFVENKHLAKTKFEIDRTKQYVNNYPVYF